MSQRDDKSGRFDRIPKLDDQFMDDVKVTTLCFNKN